MLFSEKIEVLLIFFYFAFCNSIIEQIIRFVLGGFIVYTGITNLILSFNLKKLNSNNWLSLLTIGIIMIICGLYIILVSNLILSTIGIIVIILFLNLHDLFCDISIIEGIIFS